MRPKPVDADQGISSSDDHSKPKSLETTLQMQEKLNSIHDA
jgi:hypothetical protein